MSNELVTESNVLVLSDNLSPREQEVLEQVALGHSNIRIGLTLFISERTIRTHVSNILTKLHVSNRTEAVRRAQQMGLVELVELDDAEIDILDLLSPVEQAILILAELHPGAIPRLMELGMLKYSVNLQVRPD